MKTFHFFGFLLVLLLMNMGCESSETKAPFEDLPLHVQTLSLLGDSLKSELKPLPADLSDRIDSLSDKAYEEGRIVDHLIWEGRKTAYTGDYRQAVSLFSDAIHQYPNEPRLYRHRGHRYLTLRAFDLAIRDFKDAVRLFDGTEDRIEQDGLPNAQNVPLSTLQTNTWYHLGLAYYLKGTYEEALTAYQRGRALADNPDMETAFLYWEYMTLRKMGRDAEAGRLLDQVHPETVMIENQSYHELLLVFKGYFNEEELLTRENGSLDQATLGYGLGFWHAINDRHDRSIQIWKQVVEGNNWAAFGYIGSEAELARL